MVSSVMRDLARLLNEDLRIFVSSGTKITPFPAMRRWLIRAMKPFTLDAIFIMESFREEVPKELDHPPTRPHLALGVAAPAVHFPRGGQRQCVLRPHSDVGDEDPGECGDQLWPVVVPRPALGKPDQTIWKQQRCQDTETPKTIPSSGTGGGPSPYPVRRCRRCRPSSGRQKTGCHKRLF